MGTEKYAYRLPLLMGTSIYCREKPKNKADGAQKPECTRST